MDRLLLFVRSCYLTAPGILHLQPLCLGRDEMSYSSHPYYLIYSQNISIPQSRRIKYNANRESLSVMIPDGESREPGISTYNATSGFYVESVKSLANLS
jgi:hypothetical protein